MKRGRGPEGSPHPDREGLDGPTEPLRGPHIAAGAPGDPLGHRNGTEALQRRFEGPSAVSGREHIRRECGECVYAPAEICGDLWCRFPDDPGAGVPRRPVGLCHAARISPKEPSRKGKRLLQKDGPRTLAWLRLESLSSDWSSRLTSVPAKAKPRRKTRRGQCQSGGQAAIVPRRTRRPCSRRCRIAP
jgi:hypothetical protein